MDITTRKLNFIQDLLSISDEKIIDKLETLLKKEKQKEAQQPSVYDLLGVLTKEEGEEMEKTIASCCENIHEEDWKGSLLARYKYRYGFTPIPENDIWIAAMAQEHGLPLVTRDVHFKYLPDLKILSW